MRLWSPSSVSSALVFASGLGGRLAGWGPFASKCHSSLLGLCCPRILELFLVTVIYFVKCSSIWVFCFPHDYTAVMSFGETTTEGKAILITPHQGYTLSKWLISAEVDLNLLAPVCLPASSTVKLLSPRLLPCHTFWKEVTAQLRSRERLVTLHPLGWEHLHTLLGILLHRKFISFLHLFIQ